MAREPVTVTITILANVVRKLRFLEPMTATVLSLNRRTRPPGAMAAIRAGPAATRCSAHAARSRSWTATISA
jgi:hypothetical protein